MSPELYHVGYVVDDIEIAMAHYSKALGLTWAVVTPRSLRVVASGSDTPQSVELLATYSVQGPPYVELIQELSGGVWGSGALRLDHLGYWVDDLAGSFAQLRADGLDASVQAVDEHDCPIRFSYQRASSDSGPWIELVDRAVRPGLMAWVNGGSYDV
jgi:hypothetical protein